MKRVDDFRLRLGKHELVPIMIGGMGVDISTADLALEAARLGGVGHSLEADALGRGDGCRAVRADVLDHVAGIVDDVVGENAAQHRNGGVVHAASPVGRDTLGDALHRIGASQSAHETGSQESG